MNASPKYQYKDLISFTKQLFVKAGLPNKQAEIVAETLIEADLLGHSTHGLQLLTPYLGELEKGTMQTQGSPEVMNDSGSAICWNGNFLPGPWLIREAMEMAFKRIADHPVMTFTIQKSHHIGCLAAYLELATRRGLIMLLSCSDPKNKTIAPFGGLTGVYSPNPIAAGFPTEGDPILIDISMSETANGLIIRSRKEGKKLSQPFILNNKGVPSDDPEDFFANPPGTILPLGGMHAGYKGFALGILVEALTSALGGYGRSDDPERWGASVFIQIIDPNAFGGLNNFKKEMQHLIDQSVRSTPIDANNPVRIPGARALALKREQLKNGLGLYPTIIEGMQAIGIKYDISPPLPIN